MTHQRPRDPQNVREGSRPWADLDRGDVAFFAFSIFGGLVVAVAVSYSCGQRSKEGTSGLVIPREAVERSVRDLDSRLRALEFDAQQAREHALKAEDERDADLVCGHATQRENCEGEQSVAGDGRLVKCEDDVPLRCPTGARPAVVDYLGSSSWRICCYDNPKRGKQVGEGGLTYHGDASDPSESATK